MQSLLDIEGVDGTICSLLEVAGYTDLASFSSNSPEVIYAELAKANKMLKILDQEPSLEQVKSWCESVPKSGESQIGAELEAHLETSNVEEQVLSAAPLSANFVQIHDIDLAQLPKITRIIAKAEVKEAAPKSMKKNPLVSPSKQSSKSPLTKGESEKVEVDPSKIKSVDDYRSNGSSLAALEGRRDTDNVRQAKTGTNEGVDPSSEKYIRGVLHNDSHRTYFGAWGYILAFFLLVSSIAPIAYILFNPEDYVWGALTPAILFVALIVYVSIARKSSCPVCRQRQFVPKACRKHVKAHGSPLLGNMLPTAWHLVRYKWFRCIFCGTSIRVKE